MKPTKEEISLCKQVAKRYRKEIKCGDWILRDGELRLNLDGKLAWLEDGKQDIIITITNKTEVIPLWTISDCLEFLRLSGYQYQLAFLKSPKWSNYVHVWKSITGEEYNTSSKAPLEACLKAVLAVLEEGK